MLIQVPFWSACRQGRPVPRPLPSPSPSPVTRERSCHWLERWCHGCTSLPFAECLGAPAHSLCFHQSCILLQRRIHINLSSHLFTEELLRALLALGPAPIPCPVSCGQHDGTFNRRSGHMQKLLGRGPWAQPPHIEASAKRAGVSRPGDPLTSHVTTAQRSLSLPVCKIWNHMSTS